MSRMLSQQLAISFDRTSVMCLCWSRYMLVSRYNIVVKNWIEAFSLTVFRLVGKVEWGCMYRAKIKRKKIRRGE